LFVLPAEEDAPIATNVLFMLFRDPVESLSLKFGGVSISSDSLFAPPPSGTVAGLIVGNIGDDDASTLDEVGRAFVPLDDDPAASQVIAVGAPGGLPFDFAVFGLFVDASESLTPADAIEVVDDVHFETAAAVPEPDSLTQFLTLIGLGLLPTTVVATRRPPRRARTRYFGSWSLSAGGPSRVTLCPFLTGDKHAFRGRTIRRGSALCLLRGGGMPILARRNLTHVIASAMLLVAFASAGAEPIPVTFQVLDEPGKGFNDPVLGRSGPRRRPAGSVPLRCRPLGQLLRASLSGPDG
jgi:hypothetical protein